MQMQKIKVPQNYKYAEIFLSMRCNLKCSYCLNSFDKRFDRVLYDELPGKKWIEAINRLEFPEIPLTFGGGECSLHKDFIPILNGIDSKLKVDILTNMMWSSKLIDRFLSEVNPERFKRPQNFSAIRVSYHPEQMDIEQTCQKAVRFIEKGFSIGIAGVLYPDNSHLTKLVEARFICKRYNVDFEIKNYTGKDKHGELFGNYPEYPDAIFNEEHKEEVKCRTKELLVAPDGQIYKCHRDMYARENAITNITDSDLKIENIYRDCKNYGECHPCDVKSKTDSKQNLGYTSMDILKKNEFDKISKFYGENMRL